jgi:uncharacterized protein
MSKNLKNKKGGLVIADAGPIFSLAIVNKLDLLNDLFDEVLIPFAVWEELTADKSNWFYPIVSDFFQNKIRKIQGINHLTFIMDYGESESVVLYIEQNARFLLIDDKKARKIAENFKVKCIGTLGLLIAAKNAGFILELKPLFLKLLQNNRYYNNLLLNQLLESNNESKF